MVYMSIAECTFSSVKNCFTNIYQCFQECCSVSSTPANEPQLSLEEAVQIKPFKLEDSGIFDL